MTERALGLPVVIVGMCTRDTFIEVEHGFGTNEAAVLATGATTRVGGKGYLVARAIETASKIPVKLYAEVASRDSLFAQERPDSLVRVLDHDHRVWVITSASGDQRTFVRPGRSSAEADLQLEFSLDRETCALLYLTAENIEIVRSAFAAWKIATNPPPLAVNPCVPLLDRLSDDQELLQELLASATLVLLNEFELERIQTSTCDLDTRTRNALVVVTQGERGGRYRLPGSDNWSSYECVPCIDQGLSSAGSGDVFNGTLIASIGSGNSTTVAINDAANAASAYVSELRQDIH